MSGDKNVTSRAKLEIPYTLRSKFQKIFTIIRIFLKSEAPKALYPSHSFIVSVSCWKSRFVSGGSFYLGGDLAVSSSAPPSWYSNSRSSPRLTRPESPPRPSFRSPFVLSPLLPAVAQRQHFPSGVLRCSPRGPGPVLGPLAVSA